MQRKKSGKILLAYILVLAMFSGTFSYMGSSTVQKASAKSKIPVSTIRVGQKIRIYLTANGKRVKNSKIKWASKNKKIAKISKKGVVTGVKKGTTKIYGKYKGVKYWRKIVVKKKKKTTPTQDTDVSSTTPTPVAVTSAPKLEYSDIPGYTKVFWHEPAGAVHNNPSRDIQFIVKEGKQLRLQALSTLHWNDGKGAVPGTIGLTKNGEPVGTWTAVGRDGNIWWDAFMDITLDAGNYVLVDSDRKTWSSGEDNCGINQTYGILSDVSASAAPTSATEAVNSAAPTSAAQTANPAASGTPTASPASSFDPNDYIESEEQHNNQGSIPATPKPVSTSIPGETGISTNIRISAQDINSAPKATAAVTQDNPQAKAGTVNVDFGSYNLKEDTTITVRTLPEKTDAVNGYTAALWSLDAGSQKEFILPVTVTVPYDSQVTDPEAELEAQCWNEDAGAWENVSFTINTSSHTITMNLYQAGLFGIFRDEAATKELADTEMVEENLYKKAGKNTSLSVAAATKLLPTRASYEKYARFINTALQERQFNDILNNRLSEPDEYEDVLNRSLDSITNISNGANIVVSFGDLICQQFSIGSTATKAFLSGSGSVLCGIGLGMAAIDYAKKTVGGGQSDKEYFLNAWPELLLTASSIPSSLGPVAGFLSGSGAATTAAAAAGTTLTPWLVAIAAVAVFVKSQTVDKEEPPKIQHAELMSLMRVCAEETWFNPKTGKLHMYLPEKAVNRLTALKDDDYEKYGFDKKTARKLLSRHNPDSVKANYVRLGNSRYPNYNGWVEIMDYITKEYKGHPEKWIKELEVYAWVAPRVGTLSSADANALAYALLGTSGVGDEEFGVKHKYSIHEQCQDYIGYEIMDGLQNNKFFKRFAEKFMDEVERINRRNWLKQKKELKRELTFTLVDKKGVKVSFDQFKEYQDKFICFKTAPSDFTLRAPWRVNMDSSTLATSTYLGYIEMGCHVKQIGQDTNADATQELLVYDSMEDCIRGETPVSRIFFTGPLEYGQKEVKVTVDGTLAPQTKPTATPAPTAPAETGDVELSETLVIFQGLSGSRTLTLKGAGNGRIIWSTNAGVIVRLAESADGKSCTLTPVAYGSDTVWASYGDKIFKCMVYVEKEVQFDQTAITLKKGETAKLSVINADNATVTNLDTTWSVGNAAVASLSEKTMKTVVIKAEGTGTTTITKKYTYGDGSVKILECRVTVEDAVAADPTVKPADDSFAGEYYGTYSYTSGGKNYTTKVMVKVRKESDGSYTWEEGNWVEDTNSYFMVDCGKASVSNGVLTGVHSGMMIGTSSIEVSGGTCRYSYTVLAEYGDDFVANATLYRK